MNKIFAYELRRILFNKFFVGLLVLNGVFAWFILTSDTIAGTSFTAPFSPWSFGMYLSSLMPMALLTVLFLLASFYSKKEKQVAVLTGATSVNPVRYALVRMAAVAVGFSCLCFLFGGLSIYFYAAYFDYWNYALFFLPAVLTIFPCFIFAMGFGNLIARVHVKYLYAFMFVVLAASFIQIPDAFDFFGGRFFSNYPLSLQVAADGEPVFSLSAAFLFARVFYLIAGGALFILSIRKKKVGQG